ncbi:MAG: sugar phosphate isomerase/epimerase family protein [Planctomycetota bacterium]
MKFAICNETFQDWPLERAFNFAAKCGYQGLEIAPFTLATYATEITAAQRVEVRRLAEAAGLQIIGLHWLLAKTEGFYLTSPDAETRRRTSAYLAELARLCAELGGTVMVLGSPQQRSLLPGVDRKQAMDYARQVLAEALPTLESSGVVLALEPLGPQETDFMNTADEAVELARQLDSPHVRLHLDCKAMATEPTPIPEIIRRHASMTAHFHANDPNRQGPGFGDLDFVPIFRALKESGYGGWVSVEVFDYTPGIERLARESIGYMQDRLTQV